MSGPAPAWRVEVTPDCIASGVCLALAAGVFALGDDGRAHPVAELVAPQDAVLDAAGACPMEAIALTDAASGRPLSEHGGVY